MVVINEGDDITIMRGDRAVIVMQNIRLTSAGTSGGVAQYVTLRSVTRPIMVRRSCLKCQRSWEGIAGHGEPDICYNPDCGGNQLGRIEVKS